jgi:hypothetical protein
MVDFGSPALEQFYFRQVDWELSLRQNCLPRFQRLYLKCIAGGKGVGEHFVRLLGIVVIVQIPTRVSSYIFLQTEWEGLCWQELVDDRLGSCS